MAGRIEKNRNQGKEGPSGLRAPRAGDVGREFTLLALSGLRGGQHGPLPYGGRGGETMGRGKKGDTRG